MFEDELPLLDEPELVVVFGGVVVVFVGVVVVLGAVVVVVGVCVAGAEGVVVAVEGACCVCDEGVLLKLFFVDITLYTPASIIRSTIKNVTNLFMHIV